MEFKLSIDTEKGSFEIVNMGTGEVKSVELPVKKRATRKAKQPEDENPNPQIVLGENKYVLNSAAVKLLGVEPDDHLIIKTERHGKTLIPVIGTNESFGNKSGNRVTKSYTVSCRGKANAELLEFGTVFDLEPHDKKEGLFFLHGDKAPVIEEAEEEPSEENGESKEVDVEINDNDLADLLGSDAQPEEVSALDFTMQ